MKPSGSSPFSNQAPFSTPSYMLHGQVQVCIAGCVIDASCVTNRPTHPQYRISIFECLITRLEYERSGRQRCVAKSCRSPSCQWGGLGRTGADWGGRGGSNEVSFWIARPVRSEMQELVDALHQALKPNAPSMIKARLLLPFSVSV